MVTDSPVMLEPLSVAAIDAGSNALRIRIGRFLSTGEIEFGYNERIAVRLGHNTFVQGAISGKTMKAALAAFGRFRELFTQHEVTHYRAVGTSALRNASNREDLIDRIFRDTKIELEVIDGEEEARLVRTAVLHRFAKRETPLMIMDLGGGSLEVTERTRDEWITSSMKIGTVRLLENFGITDAISTTEASLISRYVESHLRRSLPEELWDPAITVSVACGGNAEEWAKLCGESEKDGIYNLRLADLESRLPQMLAMNVADRMKTWQLRQDRAEVMAIAGLVLSTVGRVLGLKRLLVPGVGLREGVLLDLTDRLSNPLRGEPAVTAAARAYCTRLGHSTQHGDQVRKLSRQLFQQTQTLHGLPERCLTNLEMAALLHDVGEVIHRRNHHKHSEYLVLNGRFPGLSDPDRATIAAITRAHRKNFFDKRHETFQTLSSARQAEAKILTAILRIADALDTNHVGRVTDISTEIKSKKILLRVNVWSDADVPDFRTDLKASEFETMFDKKVVIEIVPGKKRAQASRSE